MSTRKADNLLLFKSIIDFGSLSSAAKATDISVSQTSKRLTHLENSLGIKLLQRSTRNLSLTNAGEILYEKLSNIKHQIDEAWQSMLEYANEPQGKLRIAASHHYAITQLFGFVKTFNETHPKIHVELELFNGKNYDGQADIYFKSHILGKNQLLPDCNLTAKKIDDEKLCYVASKSYLERNPALTHPELLTQHHCLSINAEKQWRFYQNQGIFDQKINSVFESNSFEALFQAAIAGMGIAQIPKSLLEKQNNHGLIELFDDFDRDSLSTYAYYNAHQLSSKKVSLFLASLQTSH